MQALWANLSNREEATEPYRRVVILDVKLPVVMDVVAGSLPVLTDGQLPHRLCQVDLFLQSPVFGMSAQGAKVQASRSRAESILDVKE